MLKENIKKTLNTLPEIAKYLLAAVVVLGISLLAPNDIQLQYQFEEGGRWQYEDLYASFDFAIYKAPEEIQEDQEKLEATFSPYYKTDLGVAGERKKAFADAFEKELELVKGQGIYEDILKNPEPYRRYGQALLQSYYSRGIIQVDAEHAEKGKDFVINLLEGNVADRKTLGSLATLEQVRSSYADSLFNSGLPDAEFLIPLLESSLASNIFFDKKLSRRFFEAEVQQLTITRGAVKAGQLIIRKGDLINEEMYRVLTSFSERHQDELELKYSHWTVFGGYLLLTGLVIAIFMVYLQFNEKRVFARFSNLLFLLMWVFLYSYLVHVLAQLEGEMTWLIPFAIAPIVIKNFYNDRLALFTHIAVVLIASYFSSLAYDFAYVQITAGVVAVLSNTETRFWSRFFNSIFLILLTYLFGYIGLSLIREGSIYSLDVDVLVLLLISSGLTLLAYPLIPLMEKLFGFTSAITLAELSDLNRPLLKELSLKAPGTLQHSLQVANLAEAAARRVGANALLVKTGALYHDIGKMKRPAYFIENQGSENPHATLNNPLESAGIITSHVTEGVRLARKHRLPNVLIDFIRTHHGTTRAEYFYRQHLNDHPDADDAPFRYEGPRPRTKEETILMIADSLEAAAKSLKQPDEQAIHQLVSSIVEGKLKNRQFENSELTFKELQWCKEEFQKLLVSIYHARVAYPKEAGK